jgi:hypothetical protein
MKRSSEPATITTPIVKRQNVLPIFKGFEVVPPEVISDHLLMFLDLKNVLSFVNVTKQRRADKSNNELFYRLVRRDFKFITKLKYVESKDWLAFYKNHKVTLKHEYVFPRICEYPESIESIMPIGNRSYIALIRDFEGYCNIVTGVFDWETKKFTSTCLKLPDDDDFACPPIRTGKREFVLISFEEHLFITFYKTSVAKTKENKSILSITPVYRAGIKVEGKYDRGSVSGFEIKGDCVVVSCDGVNKLMVLALVPKLVDNEAKMIKDVRFKRTKLDFSEVYKDMYIYFSRSMYNEVTNNVIIVIGVVGRAFFDVFECSLDKLFKDNIIKPQDRKMFKRFDFKYATSKPFVERYMDGYMFAEYDTEESGCMFPIKICDKNFEVLGTVGSVTKSKQVNGVEQLVKEELPDAFKCMTHNKNGDLIVDCVNFVRVFTKQQSYKDYKFVTSGYGNHIIELAEDKDKQTKECPNLDEFDVDTLIDNDRMPNLITNMVCLDSGIILALCPYDGYVYQ